MTTSSVDAGPGAPVPATPPDAAVAALAARLEVVADAFGLPAGDPVGLFDMVRRLAVEVAGRGDSESAWLLIVGLTGAMPDQDLVHAVRRGLALCEPDEAVSFVLDRMMSFAVSSGQAGARLRLVTDRPMVDVNFTAKSGFLTGIQRVVRGVLRQWAARHEIEIVVWSSRGGGYRSPRPSERTRLLESDVEVFRGGDVKTAPDADEILVPWGVPVVLTEVPSADQSDQLAAVAELTSSSVRLIGYDCIPISSAEAVPLAEPEKFGRYLELVKHAERVAGISHSATEEFAAYARALEAQGLPGPAVTACPLPHTLPMATGSDSPEDGSVRSRPLVVSLGTIGRRKNQTALVVAAELLWREGLDFDLQLLGHVGAEHSPVSGLVRELRALGRTVEIASGVSDAHVRLAFREARCLVFPTLHEGFGLPVVEALSSGVPVITSDFGSTREVAEAQGGLLVDPEDVDALADALRRLLTDDRLHARLVAEAQARPPRDWLTYADDLWEVLLGV